MKRFATLLLAPLAFALAMLVALPAYAGDAQDYFKGKHAKLSNLLKKPASGARDAEISKLLDEMIDFERLTRDSLAEKHRTARKTDELNDFRATLEKLVKKNYKKNIRKSLNYEVKYLGERPLGGGAALVRTRVKSKKNKGEDEPISVEYSLHKKSGKWVIYDITTEKSSMVRNYRNQFNKIIKKHGWAGLMEKLNKKLNK